MAANAIENFARWNLQIALLAIVAMVLVRLLRIHAPVLRHAFWRAILVTCLALPLLQPWRSTMLTGSLSAVDGADAALLRGVGEQSLAAGAATPTARVVRFTRSNWPALTATALLAGAFLRLVWLGLGIYRLQRIRRAGTKLGKTADCAEIEILIEAGAEIRRVDRLGQPVTFGILSPAVLLPESFARMPPGVQRAVLAHELWHVRRRDWMWVLVEEGIRAAFWFNPAMWWVISRVQSSREEVVDELTIQLTNNRQTYLEALLAFADEPTLFPATPFARRRDLFHRMLLISREAVMSSRRIIASCAAMASVLLGTAFSASLTFPLQTVVAASSSAAEQQNPPRDRRPGQAGPETARERELKAAIQANPANSDLYFQLATLQVNRSAPDEADGTIESLKLALPGKQGIALPIAEFYVRSGQFDRAISTLDDAAAANPTSADAQQVLAVFYLQKVSKDASLLPTDRQRYVDAGIAANERALAIRPDFAEALAFRSVLLRMKAGMVAEESARQAILAEAETARLRAMELRKGTPQGEMAFSPRPGQPPPPPPPPPPADLFNGQAPIRVGGNVKPPVKTRDVKPEYPAVARDAGVQGVIILEVTIGPAGDVVEARILRGVPLLDGPALDAVRQWQFAPTQLNGVAVPVIMTVTVNFTLQ